MSRPLVLILVLYALGIVIGYFISLPVYLLLCGIVIAAGVAVVKQVAARDNSCNIRFILYAAALLCGILMCRYAFHVSSGNTDFLAGKYTVFTGSVVAGPNRRTDRTDYVVEIEMINYYVRPDGARAVPDFRPKGRVLVSVKGSGPEFGYGDRLQAAGLLLRTEEPGNPGEFDYRKYLEDRGIRLVLKSLYGSGLTKIGTGPANPLIRFSISLKDRLMAVITQNMPEVQAALVEGILFGSTGRISPEIKEQMAVAGVAHILSVSGYHVGLLAGFVLLLGNIAGLRKPARDVVAAVSVGLYALMAGAGPAVTRSLIMAWVLLLTRYVRQEYDWPSSMSLAALIILIINPLDLFNPGFQFSFLATWGILCLAPLFKMLHGFLPPLGQTAAVTLAAQIALFPVTAYYFNYFSLVFLPANLIIVPLISIVMLLGGTAAILGLMWNVPAEILCISTSALLDLTILMAGAIAGLPFAVINLRPPGIIEITSYYLLIGLVVALCRNREFRVMTKRLWCLNRPVLILTLLAVLAVALWGGIAYSGSELLEVTFIDVGQGDAALVQTPGGRNLLIDTGGVPDSSTGFDVGEQVLVPFLIRKGVREIDVLVLTHPHLDHIQGASALDGKFKIKSVVVAPQFALYPEGAGLIQKLSERNIEIREVCGGENIYFGEDIILEVLSPNCSTAVNANDDSLVIRLVYRDFRAVFTGDAESVPLEAIIERGRECRADIVKIPHHGSSNAWTVGFLRAVSPKAAVISVGQNLFGHPSPKVLEGLERMKIQVFRTDRDGAVTVRSNGYGYKVTTAKGMN